ncbi:MAG: serine/threonine protein kinase [bacterium]|nr:serine/threonine protein kinase [bacterium]
MNENQPEGATAFHGMSPERWRRLDALFRDAVERDDADRAALLDRACDGDAELRREVEELLDAHRRAGSFLEDAALDEAARLAESRAGQRIGAYEVVEQLGRGGMGTVYLAVRADERYRKQVAIKVITRGLDTDEVQRRFRQERQILAGLDHPNIAGLLDAATSDDGLPCFVMEYVDGTRIDHYCERQRLSVNQRLELFRTVCSAVQAAHRNLVVHRDLKPSNILVTADGVPKLLDFGIAKLLDPASFDQTVEPTARPFRRMTPEYASPEQVRSENITTASDVYSLGVLLYVLLTGRPPYRVDTNRATEMERVICEQEPERPSAAGPERRRLSGDLDTVVLKALAKEPERRYASVEQLSGDLKRHLVGQPIIARPPTFSYRAGKFLRRHRTGVAMAALSVALLLAGIVTTAWQAHVATTARATAEAERGRAEEVTGFLEELFQVADPSRTEGETITARELLDRGAARLADQPWEQPEVQARLLDAIGWSYHGLGYYDDAGRYLEEALVIRRRVLGREHLAVAESLDNMAALLLARGEYAAARTSSREALEMRRRLLGDEHPSVAESLNNLAQALQAEGDYAAAEPLLREALAMKKRLLGDDHPSVAVGVNNLAGVLNLLGDYETAEPLFREALGARRRLLGEKHPQVAESLNNLGLILYRQRDYQGAETHFRQALDLRRQLYGEEHPAVARGLGNLATVLLDSGDYARAEPLSREALAMKERLLGEEHPSLAFNLNSLGQVLEVRGGGPGAEALYRRALRLRREALPPGHRHLATSALALGQLLLDRGDLEQAEPLLREALEIRRARPEDAWRVAEAESALAGLLAALGRLRKAETLLAASCDVLEAELGPEDRRARRARERLRDLARQSSYGSGSAGGQMMIEQDPPTSAHTSQ